MNIFHSASHCNLMCVFCFDLLVIIPYKYFRHKKKIKAFVNLWATIDSTPSRHTKNLNVNWNFEKKASTWYFVSTCDVISPKDTNFVSVFFVVYFVELLVWTNFVILISYCYLSSFFDSQLVSFQCLRVFFSRPRLETKLASSQIFGDWNR